MLLLASAWPRFRPEAFFSSLARTSRFFFGDSAAEDLDLARGAAVDFERSLFFEVDRRAAVLDFERFFLDFDLDRDFAGRFDRELDRGFGRGVDWDLDFFLFLEADLELLLRSRLRRLLLSRGLLLLRVPASVLSRLRLRLR